MRHIRQWSTAIVVGTALTVTACASDGDARPKVPSALVAAATPLRSVNVVVHRSPTCSCCGGWQDAVRAAGATVTEEHHADVTGIKETLKVPKDQRSCHTSVIGGYVVEGHVPVLAIQQLLERKPNVDGIALAGMPAGAPGMPGAQTGPLLVTTIDDGQVVGEFGRY